MTEGQAEAALLAHLDEHAVSLLRSMLTGAPYQPPLATGPDLDYIVSAYVIETFERDPEGFEYLEGLIKGSMLASTLYLSNIGEVERRFERTTMYFDTRVLLRALGYEGNEVARAQREAFDLAYELGAKLACFDHTLTELRGVLYAAAANIGRQRPSGLPLRSVEAFFAAAGYRRSDTEVLIDNLEKDLKSLRIEVVDRPPHAADTTVDEAALATLLGERISYSQNATLQHDLDSLTAIHTLRRGKPQPRLEDAHGIFITTNTALVIAGRDFFVGDVAGIWPPAIMEHDFATLVWLKRPTAAPELPRLHIIADCYAAMEPSSSLWLRYLGEIDSLEAKHSFSEQEYYLLRFAAEARRAMMEQTLGDTHRVSGELITRVLEQVKASYVKPVEAQLTEVEASRLRAEESLGEAMSKSHDLELRAAAAESTVDLLVQIDRARARRQAGLVGRMSYWALFAAIGVIAAATAWVGLAPLANISTNLPSVLEWPARIVLGAGLVLGFLGTLFDLTAPRAARWLEVRVARRVETRILRRSMAVEVSQHLQSGP